MNATAAAVSDDASPTWPMRVESSLAAHFKMPDGPSRPGVSWLIGVIVDGQTHHVRVKALLADDATRATRRDLAYQANTAMQYIADLLTGGWHPTQERDHTIHIGNPIGPAAAGEAARRPWWRLW